MHIFNTVGFCRSVPVRQGRHSEHMLVQKADCRKSRKCKFQVDSWDTSMVTMMEVKRADQLAHELKFADLNLGDQQSQVPYHIV